MAGSFAHWGPVKALRSAFADGGSVAVVAGAAAVAGSHLRGGRHFAASLLGRSVRGTFSVG